MSSPALDLPDYWPQVRRLILDADEVDPARARWILGELDRLLTQVEQGLCEAKKRWALAKEAYEAAFDEAYVALREQKCPEERAKAQARQVCRAQGLTSAEQAARLQVEQLEAIKRLLLQKHQLLITYSGVYKLELQAF